MPPAAGAGGPRPLPSGGPAGLFFSPRAFGPAAPFKKETNQGRGLRPPHPPGASPLVRPSAFLTPSIPHGASRLRKGPRAFGPPPTAIGASPQTPLKGLRPLRNPAMPAAGLRGSAPKNPAGAGGPRPLVRLRLTSPSAIRRLRRLTIRGFAP